MSRTTAYIGIGSNVGDRFANLQQAVELLSQAPETTVTAVSRVYMTEPVGDIEQDRFFNGVVTVLTGLDPLELRTRCKSIEQQLGRPDRYRRWSPRTIDLDILLYGDLCVMTELLIIPHAELHRRKFVLVPMLDIDNPMHPLLHRSIAELLRTCGDHSVPIRLTEQLVKP
ncbi:MAG: 2-amino-4-hydroxy-6-hydroxymethyldihydropteridine diphosphokinase [Chlorobiaceae bacterium]|nr:2-amino-4-hydroxy-6-hydroxymethyldihydropteridine diphosphokinase [Chlorobiaceae bacterium]